MDLVLLSGVFAAILPHGQSLTAGEYARLFTKSGCKGTAKVWNTQILSEKSAFF